MIQQGENRELGVVVDGVINADNVTSFLRLRRSSPHVDQLPFLAGALESLANHLCDVAGAATLSSGSSVLSLHVEHALHNDDELREIRGMPLLKEPEGRSQFMCSECRQWVSVDQDADEKIGNFQCEKCK